ncbi:MAG TPA: type II toxin-antitoxin system VapC family toxin [Pseudolabrys sp.]|nr:type II toxin-antitoxin system VapC family toxin [Pseudolabrys sp.]
MLYFDTSFLIPLVLEEPTSAQIEQFMQSRADDELGASHWTRAEISSALARTVRMGLLDEDSALEADSKLDEVLSNSFTLLLPDLEDFELCKRYLSHYESGLRAGDALHLAIANNRGATAIYSLDKKLSEAGRRFGLRVNVGIHVG